METLFWITSALLLYTFIGYPLILMIIALLYKKPASLISKACPSASMILAVYNEESVIREKLANFETINYPKDKLELIVVSDCSSDRTNEILASCRSERIVPIFQNERAGKTAALNRAAEIAKGEILVFTDADSIFKKDALERLVSNFSSEEIGLVSGRTEYISGKETSDSFGINLYTQYEEFIKRKEGRIGMLVGADGAIYALRKSLYKPLKTEYINDLAHPVYTILAGYKVIYEPGAICTEPLDLKETGKNFGRQTRIMSQSWLVFFSHIGKLLMNGGFIYAWAFTSHKFLRWLTLPMLAFLFVCNSYMLKNSVFFNLLYKIQLIFLILVILGIWRKDSIVRLPYLFLKMNAASITGLINLTFKNSYVTWVPRGK